MAEPFRGIRPRGVVRYLRKAGVPHRFASPEETGQRLWPFATALVGENVAMPWNRLVRLRGRVHEDGYHARFLWDFLVEDADVERRRIRNPSADRVALLLEYAPDRAVVADARHLDLTVFRGLDVVVIAYPSLEWACFHNHELYEPPCLQASPGLLSRFADPSYGARLAGQMRTALRHPTVSKAEWFSRQESVGSWNSMCETLRRRGIAYRVASEGLSAEIRDAIVQAVAAGTGLSAQEVADRTGITGERSMPLASLWNLLPDECEMPWELRAIETATSSSAMVAIVFGRESRPALLVSRKSVRLFDLLGGDVVFMDYPSRNWQLLSCGEPGIGPYLLESDLGVNRSTSARHLVTRGGNRHEQGQGAVEGHGEGAAHLKARRRRGDRGRVA